MCHLFWCACMHAGVGVRVCLCELCALLSHGINYLIMSSSESNTGTGSNVGLCVGTKLVETR